MHRNHAPAEPTRSRLLVLAITLAVVAVACGGDGSAPEATTTTVAAPTSAVDTTTTTIEATTTTVEPAFTRTSDVVYMTVDGTELLMDVYAPDGDGPWPVVVAFHGLDSRGKDSLDNIPLAEAAAAEGMLVFTPSWIVWDPPPFPFTIETFNGWREIAGCAVAFAQETARALGGDPGTTVLYGFSGGAGAALIAATQPTSEPIQGCESDAAPTSAQGIVLGDGVYFLHNPDFDTAFDADLEAMQGQVAALVDPANWPADLDAEFILWVAEEGTNPRVFLDSPDETEWIVSRDPSGSIRADLDELGELDDGVISTVDAGRLLELRLARAGFEVTLDAYPGGHRVGNKLPELLDYLLRAAA